MVITFFQIDLTVMGTADLLLSADKSTIDGSDCNSFKD